jgi:L-seryl-tRNA(Ser) seleniumtransferase
LLRFRLAPIIMGMTNRENNDASGLRALPSVDRVLAESTLAETLASYKREIVVDAVRDELTSARAEVLAGGQAPTATAVADAVLYSRLAAWRRWPTPVINATGVILHTNLGRAPMSAAAAEAAGAAGEGYSDLELELSNGRRGSRHTAVAALLHQLTGAEAAIAVNNNAGAMLLGLAAIAAGKEVVVSRGEASEIGGGFRIPDVLVQSGATLVEVGTVNRTYARDYEKAITENTGALLVVHRSNFKVVGFTAEPSLADIVEVGNAHGLPVLHDLGSGALLDTADFGLTHETMPQESLAAGAGLAFFSGDKLLGGPQAGIVVGSAELVGMLATHPLARALRADKLTLAALHATLLHYAKNEAAEQVPVWRMIALSTAEIQARAGAMAKEIGKLAGVVGGLSAMGGGSLPADEMPTWLVSIDPSSVSGGADALAQRLRTGDIAVMPRIEADRILLDPRTIPPGRDTDVIRVVKAALG